MILGGALRAILAAAALITLPAGASGPALPMPCLTGARDFLQLPPGRLLGDVSGVALDRAGHVWVLHRPATLAAAERAGALPPVAEFSAQGRYLGGFGGPGEGYEWPRVEHSIALTPQGRVWISGNFRANPAQADDMLLEFTADGRFLRQIGRRGASQGNADTANFHAPGDLAVDWPRGEIYVADGYGNRRVMVIDARSGRFKRMWGAFGSVPTLDPAPAPRAPGRPFVRETGDGPRDFNSVHGVILARDGTVYVSDRNNQRIQAFTRAGRYLGQVFVDRNLASPTTASGMAMSDDPGQRYLFVADFGNSALVIVDRKRLAVIGRTGKDAGSPPQFTTPHLMAGDGKGHIFVTEVAARTVQRITVQASCRRP